MIKLQAGIKYGEEDLPGAKVDNIYITFQYFYFGVVAVPSEWNYFSVFDYMLNYGYPHFGNC